MKLKNYFSTLLLLAGFSFAAKAQVVTTSPSPVYDNDGSVTVHFHPYEDGATGDVFNNYMAQMYVYTYYTTSSGITHEYTGWTSVGTTPALEVTRVDSNDFVWTIPDLRSFFSVPADTLMSNFVVIFRDTNGTIQTGNLVVPVLEPTATAPATGIVVTTNPTTILSTTPSFTVHFHPYEDTTNGGTGNSSLPFENYGDSLYVYSWAPVITPASTSSHEATAWGSVGTTPAMKATKVDSNDYTWTVTDMGTFYHMDGGTHIDTIGVIFRNAGGTVQTENFYIPITFDPTGIVTITAAGGFGMMMQPNPATSQVNILIANDKNAASTIRVMNGLGQVVLTQNVSAQSHATTLSLAGLSTGTYYVELSSGANKTTQQLIKQ